MDRKILAAASVFGALAIVLGAFGAHALKAKLEPEMLAVFETGVKYQMYHALFLLFAGITTLVSDKAKKAILWLTVTGILFFSFSLYIIACKDLFSIEIGKFGIITPIGGLLLLCAWVVFFLQIVRPKR